VPGRGQLAIVDGTLSGAPPAIAEASHEAMMKRSGRPAVAHGPNEIGIDNFAFAPRELTVKAVSLNTIGFSMARVLGPMLAGYLIAAFGGAGTFFLQGVLYAASGVMVLFVVFPSRIAPAEQKSPWHDMAEGLRRSFTDPPATLLVLPNGWVKVAAPLPQICADLRRDTLAQAWKAYRDAWHDKSVVAAAGRAIEDASRHAEANAWQLLPVAQV